MIMLSILLATTFTCCEIDEIIVEKNPCLRYKELKISFHQNLHQISTRSLIHSRKKN